VRREDPRIGARIRAALGDARTVVNVGAGSGAYEPADLEVTAVEPSEVMIAQRPEGSAPVVRAFAEELPFEDGSFDVVVMNNVLDHVQDADRCLERATGLLRPGGIFVFGQDLSDDEDVRNHPEDIGHPIRLAREDVDRHLTDLETLLRKDLTREQGREPRLHYGTLSYAGRKPAE
jgi:SAM-dependent methyltransferase